MRFSIRLLVTIGLVVSGCLLDPLATSAAPTAGGPGAEPSGQPQPKPATPSPSKPAGGSPSAERRTPLAATSSSVPQPKPRTTILRRPAYFSLTGTARLSYRADRPGVKFRCRLRGLGHVSFSYGACPATSTAGTTTGTRTWTRLRANPSLFGFTVQAYVPAVPASGGSPGTPEIRGNAVTYRWRVYSVLRRDHYTAPGGARFNKPKGSRHSRRNNLTHVIRTINSMPGYSQGTRGGPCPARPSTWPSVIRISLYSMVDPTFARAAKAASRRCVSVQILMNNHLSAKTDHSWGVLQRALGASAFSHGSMRRSFAKRCHFGCRGHGVLHTKMYVFDSRLPAPQRSRNIIRKTVMVGSSNITSNASKVQWNDLFTIRRNQKVFHDYQQMFDRMARGHKTNKMIRYNEGAYYSIFWPQSRRSIDPYTTMLRSVHCAGANGGAGIHGRSVIYINMHAWFGNRGVKLAHLVRGLYGHGCYVRVLYSFMSFGVFKILKRGAGGRMSVRRTLFSRNGHTASVYSHMKNIDISGHIGADRSAWTAYTGSNNFTDEGRHFDEVRLQIRTRSAYTSYVRWFKYISRVRSSARYANFSEPVGGGRAPG